MSPGAPGASTQREGCRARSNARRRSNSSSPWKTDGLRGPSRNDSFAGTHGCSCRNCEDWREERQVGKQESGRILAERRRRAVRHRPSALLRTSPQREHRDWTRVIEGRYAGGEIQRVAGATAHRPGRRFEGAFPAAKEQRTTGTTIRTFLPLMPTIRLVLEARDERTCSRRRSPLARRARVKTRASPKSGANGKKHPQGAAADIVEIRQKGVVHPGNAGRRRLAWTGAATRCICVGGGEGDWRPSSLKRFLAAFRSTASRG